VWNFLSWGGLKYVFDIRKTLLDDFFSTHEVAAVLRNMANGKSTGARKFPRKYCNSQLEDGEQ
jgi:hypothetical protein